MKSSEIKEWQTSKSEKKQKIKHWKEVKMSKIPMFNNEAASKTPNKSPTQNIIIWNKHEISKTKKTTKIVPMF